MAVKEGQSIAVIEMSVAQDDQVGFFDYCIHPFGIPEEEVALTCIEEYSFSVVFNKIRKTMLCHRMRSGMVISEYCYSHFLSGLV